MSVPQLLASLVGHDEKVTALSVLPGRRLASGSSDCTIRVWDTRSLEANREIGLLKGHTGAITSLLALPDGQLGSASVDRTIRIWDLERFREVVTLPGHRNKVLSLCAVQSTAVDDAGTPKWLLMSSSTDPPVKAWDVQAGQEVFEICGHTDSVTALVSPGSDRLISVSRDTALKVWNTSSPKDVCMVASRERAHEKQLTAVLLLPNGFLVTGSLDRSIKVWKSENMAELWTGSGHSAGIIALALLPDGRFASAAADGLVKLWDVANHAASLTIRVDRTTTTALAVLADGSLVTGGAGCRDVLFWDVEVRKEVGSLFRHESAVLALAGLPSGQLVSGTADGALRLWDVDSCRTAAEVPGSGVAVAALAAVASGSVVAAFADGIMMVFEPDLSSGRRLDNDRWVTSIAALPDGSFASGSAKENSLTVWAMDSSTAVAVLHGHNMPIMTVVALPSGEVASGSKDFSIKVWDIGARREAFTLLGHTDIVTSLDVLPSGNLISAADDKKIKIWDVEGRYELVELASSWGLGLGLVGVVVLRVLANGWLATSVREKTVRVWTHSIRTDLSRSLRGDGILQALPAPAQTALGTS